MFFRIAAVLVAVATLARAEAWKNAADIDLNATQNAYSDNWNGSEVGAVSWVFNSNTIAEKQLNGKMNLKNSLKLSFGQTHSQNADTRKWAMPVKSTDLIDLESLLKLTLGEIVDPYAAGRIETKFIDDQDTPLNPAKITESAGASRTFIKKDKVNLNARAGLAIRQLMVYNHTTTNDGGLDFVAEYLTPLSSDNITFNSKLQVYTAFFNSNSEVTDATAKKGYWKSPDVNWENILSANISKYINVNLYTQWLYDKEIDKTGRFKQTLSLGIKYKLL